MKIAVIVVVVSGCTTELSLHDGASQLFVREHVCPAERLTIKPRPDLPPHVVLPPEPMATMPAEIAGDPERVRLWRSQQPHPPDLDAIGATFEVSGCNTTALLVCAHPRADGSQGPWSAEIDPGPQVSLFTDSHADLPNTTAISSQVVTSSVVCLPGTAPAR